MNAKTCNNELVSVIIPLYNSERFIVETIESVLNQTYKLFEIILVDDCSTDNTAFTVKKYLKQNIRYYRLEKNSGAAVARNKGIEEARGKYIAFLDSDDVWYPDKLSIQLNLMKKKDIGFCYTASVLVNECNQILKNKISVPEAADYEFILKNTVIVTSSVMINRNLTDIKMPLLRGGQDYAAWLSVLRDGTVAYGVNEVLVKYRVRKGSLSGNKFKSLLQVYRIQTEFEKLSKPQALLNVCFFAFHAIKKKYFYTPDLSDFYKPLTDQYDYNYLVSVIAPLSEHEKQLSKCIDCIQGQTYENWELIFVDGTPGNKALKTVTSYARFDKRIKYFRMDQKSDNDAMLAYAIKKASGRFIAFLDTGDIWQMQKLSSQMAFLISRKVGFVYTGYQIACRPVTVPGSVKKPKDIPGFSVMLDKKIIGEITYHEERAAYLSILKRGYKAYGINEALVMREDLTSRHFKTVFLSVFYFLKKRLLAKE